MAFQTALYAAFSEWAAVAALVYGYTSLPSQPTKTASG